MLDLGLALAVAAAVVICIVLLLVLTLLGMKRYGLTLPSFLPLPGSKCGSDEKQEMEWDNSALNITVNPLDGDIENGYEDDVEIFSVEKGVNLGEILKEDGDVTDEEVDKNKVHSNDTKELEWDDSTLSY